MYSDETYENERIEERNVNNNNSGGFGKIIWIVLAIIVIVVIIMFFILKKDEKEPNIPVLPSVTMTTDTQNVSLNYSVRLLALISNAPTGGVLIWTSSDNNVATVDGNGVVSGINFGTATITATYTHTNGQVYYDDCVVTVSQGNQNVPINSVNFQEGEVLISIGDTFNLPVIINPSDGYVTNVKYESTNPQVLEVDQNGKITAKTEGTATVSLDYNDGHFKDQIVVNVVKERVSPQVFIPATSITFKDKLLKLKTDEVQMLEYEINPSNALTSYLVWESSDPTVVSVTNGIIRTLKEGTAEITLKSLNNASDTMTIEVEPSVIPVESIEVLTPTSLELEVESTSSIISNVMPVDATNKNIKYASNNPIVATVNESGIITAISKGTAIITLTTEDGNKTATVTVNVKAKSSSGGSSGGSTIGTLSVSTKNVIVKPAHTSIINVLTAGAKITSCTSSDTNVVTIAGNTDTTCTVKGVSTAGSAKITINAKKSGKTYRATVSVTVSNDDISLSLSPSKLNLKKGDTGSIDVMLNGKVTSSSDFTWSVISGSDIVSVNNGKVTGKKEGYATIKAYSSSLNLSATCTVEVVSSTVTEVTKIYKIGVTADYLNLQKNGTLTLTVATEPTNDKITWNSSNGNFVSISPNGNKATITAKNVTSSDVTITASTTNGKSVSWRVSVTCDDCDKKYAYSATFACKYTKWFWSDTTNSKTVTSGYIYNSSTEAMNACETARNNFSCPLTAFDGVPFNSVTGTCTVKEK